MNKKCAEKTAFFGKNSQNGKDFWLFSQKKRAFEREDALGFYLIRFFLPRRRRGAESFILKKTSAPLRRCGKKITEAALNAPESRENWRKIA
jgi:hypothetical protein